MGYINAKVKVGERPVIVQRLEVLNSDNPTFILGRTFMSQFREISFDFEWGRVKLGNKWEPVQAAVSGSSPIARANTIRNEADEFHEASDGRVLINTQLTEPHTSMIQQVLSEFPSLFAKNPKRPSRVTQDFAHVLDLDRSEPLRTRPRRIPPSWEEEVERQVEEMCRNDICRPFKSVWASDVVLVRKKDGQMRFAIHYRQLNAITKRDAYGPPNPQSILDKLTGSCYSSCLDIASAYWCVPMREKDIPKLPFTRQEDFTRCW